MAMFLKNLLKRPSALRELGDFLTGDGSNESALRGQTLIGRIAAGVIQEDDEGSGTILRLLPQIAQALDLSVGEKGVGALFLFEMGGHLEMTYNFRCVEGVYTHLLSDRTSAFRALYHLGRCQLMTAESETDLKVAESLLWLAKSAHGDRNQETASLAHSRLALLLCQAGAVRQREAEEELRQLRTPKSPSGRFTRRLAQCVLHYFDPLLPPSPHFPGPITPLDNHSGDVSRLLFSVDNVLPPRLLSRLQAAFGVGSPFWREHRYDVERSSYFSYLHVLGKEGDTAWEGVKKKQKGGHRQAVGKPSDKKKRRLEEGEKEETGDSPSDASEAFSSSAPQGSCVLPVLFEHLQTLLEPVFPRVREAKSAEWWVHCRPHQSGHQFHFDSENEGKGEVLNPIVSTVLYLTPEGIGGPTLVTDLPFRDEQGGRVERLAERGWMTLPRENRLTAFRGDLLHGVIPGRGVAPLYRVLRDLQTCDLLDEKDNKGGKEGEGKKRKRPGESSPASSSSEEEEQEETTGKDINGGKRKRTFPEKQKEKILKLKSIEDALQRTGQTNSTAKGPLRRVTLMVAFWAHVPRRPYQEGMPGSAQSFPFPVDAATPRGNHKWPLLFYADASKEIPRLAEECARHSPGSPGQVFPVSPVWEALAPSPSASSMTTSKAAGGQKGQDGSHPPGDLEEVKRGKKQKAGQLPHYNECFQGF